MKRKEKKRKNRNRHLPIDEVARAVINKFLIGSYSRRLKIRHARLSDFILFFPVYRFSGENNRAGGLELAIFDENIEVTARDHDWTADDRLNNRNKSYPTICAVRCLDLQWRDRVFREIIFILIYTGLEGTLTSGDCPLPRCLIF